MRKIHIALDYNIISFELLSQHKLKTRKWCRKLYNRIVYVLCNKSLAEEITFRFKETHTT